MTKNRASLEQSEHEFYEGLPEDYVEKVKNKAKSLNARFIIKYETNPLYQSRNSLTIVCAGPSLPFADVENAPAWLKDLPSEREYMTAWVRLY